MLGANGQGTFTANGTGHALLLVAAGPITAVPLMLFAAASSRVPLSRMGLMQYLTPTIQFAIGVAVRHEPLPALRLVGFLTVWVALAVFTIEGATRRRRQQPAGEQVTLAAVVPNPVR